LSKGSSFSIVLEAERAQSQGAARDLASWRTDSCLLPVSSMVFSLCPALKSLCVQIPSSSKDTSERGGSTALKTLSPNTNSQALGIGPQHEFGGSTIKSVTLGALGSLKALSEGNGESALHQFWLPAEMDLRLTDPCPHNHLGTKQTPSLQQTLFADSLP
jgi:hypothetical protein